MPVPPPLHGEIDPTTCSGGARDAKARVLRRYGSVFFLPEYTQEDRSERERARETAILISLLPSALSLFLFLSLSSPRGAHVFFRRRFRKGTDKNDSDACDSFMRAVSRVEVSRLGACKGMGAWSS